MPPDSTIVAPAQVCASSVGNTAFVPDAGPGARYLWTIKGATITSGAGTRAIVFTAGTKPIALLVTVIDAAGCSSTNSVTIGIRPDC
jgi:hypothetical protein